MLQFSINPTLWINPSISRQISPKSTQTRKKTTKKWAPSTRARRSRSTPQPLPRRIRAPWYRFMSIGVVRGGWRGGSGTRITQVLGRVDRKLNQNWRQRMIAVRFRPAALAWIRRRVVAVIKPLLLQFSLRLYHLNLTSKTKKRLAKKVPNKANRIPKGKWTLNLSFQLIDWNFPFR